MKRFEIAQAINGGVIVEDEDGDYVLHAEAAPAVEALQAFVKQWNACGPNSDFGRFFQRTYTQARAALDVIAKGAGSAA